MQVMKIVFFYLKKSNWTPLHVAVKWNRIQAVETLLKYGADVNIKNDAVFFVYISKNNVFLLNQFISFHLILQKCMVYQKLLIYSERHKENKQSKQLF